MDLPVIALPKIDLPFDIPLLIHPSVVHFAIAIPVIVLLLEFYNMFAKRKSIGGFSFLLLIITIVVLLVSYYTGVVDAKETYSVLSPEGKEELKAHKLLGVYVVFMAMAVVLFKLLAMTGKRFFKLLYFIALIGLILITFQQGKEGGEVVYEHGANVKIIKEMKYDLADAKEELVELEQEAKAKQEANAKAAALQTHSVEAPVFPQTVAPSEPMLVETEINATL